jgi:hypothetical protein
VKGKPRYIVIDAVALDQAIGGDTKFSAGHKHLR